MSEAELVPVFIPSLADLLAAATAQAGRHLTEAEVLEMRDRSVCMMMAAPQARAMEQSRGFRDVDPEDAWADWHRLKVERTGRGYLPKLVLGLRGDSEFPGRAAEFLSAQGVEYDLANDAVYLLTSNYTSGQAPEVCRRTLALAARLLRDFGALSMQCESSGTSHTREGWLELIEADSLVEALVLMPIGDKENFWSCGMHLLGRTDVIAASTREVQETAELFETFCEYLVLECDHFASGNTFRCAADQPRWRGVWEPCSGYAEDDFFFNPFGRVRFTLA